MSQKTSFLKQIKFLGLFKEPKEIKKRPSRENKINLFWVCKNPKELRELIGMIKDEYLERVNLVKCSKLDSLSQMKEVDYSIILLNQVFSQDVMTALGAVKPIILIYSNSIEAESIDQLNTSMICMATKSQRLLIKYFRSLLSQPIIDLNPQDNQKLQTPRQLPRLLRHTPDKRAPSVESSTKHLNDNWKNPSPDKYYPNLGSVSSRLKQKPKMIPLEK